MHISAHGLSSDIFSIIILKFLLPTYASNFMVKENRNIIYFLLDFFMDVECRGRIRVIVNILSMCVIQASSIHMLCHYEYLIHVCISSIHSIPFFCFYLTFFHYSSLYPQILFSNI